GCLPYSKRHHEVGSCSLGKMDGIEQWGLAIFGLEPKYNRTRLVIIYITLAITNVNNTYNFHLCIYRQSELPQIFIVTIIQNVKTLFYFIGTEMRRLAGK